MATDPHRDTPPTYPDIPPPRADAEVEHRPGADAGGSTVKGAGVMLVLAILLSWLPVIGPLTAGFVGGRMIGEEKRAIAVALLPAIVLAIVVGLVLAAFDLPILGAVAGIGIAIAIVLQELPLLAGAWFGGKAASHPRATGLGT